jgi:hypothetical protein
MISLRLRWLPVLGAAVWAASSPAWAADSFAAGVLSCAAETDREHRLDCYDRAVASYTARLSDGKRGASSAAAVGAAASGAATASGPALRDPAAAASVPAVAAPAAASTPDSSASSVPTAAPGSGAAGTGVAGSGATSGKTTAAAARHVVARIVSIDNFPDYVVVHLDNQQIWKQVSESSGGPLLRVGDSVTVDREMGSYWLAGPKGEAVQVKLEAPKP